MIAGCSRWMLSMEWGRSLSPWKGDTLRRTYHKGSWREMDNDMANNTKYIPSGQWTYLGYRDKDWSHVIPNKNIRSGTWITIRQEFNGVIALYRQQMMCTHDFAHFTVTLFDQLFMARKKNGESQKLGNHPCADRRFTPCEHIWGHHAPCCSNLFVCQLHFCQTPRFVFLQAQFLLRNKHLNLAA